MEEVGCGGLVPRDIFIRAQFYHIKKTTNLREKLDGLGVKAVKNSHTVIISLIFLLEMWYSPEEWRQVSILANFYSVKFRYGFYVLNISQYIKSFLKRRLD